MPNLFFQSLQKDEDAQIYFQINFKLATKAHALFFRQYI